MIVYRGTVSVREECLQAKSGAILLLNMLEAGAVQLVECVIGRICIASAWLLLIVRKYYVTESRLLSQEYSTNNLNQHHLTII